MRDPIFDSLSELSLTVIFAVFFSTTFGINGCDDKTIGLSEKSRKYVFRAIELVWENVEKAIMITRKPISFFMKTALIKVWSWL